MSRLSSTLRLDLRLQQRYKLYWIIAVAALVVGGALRSLFAAGALHFFMPLLALSSVTLTTFFLVGVLLLLERNEGTLDVVLVTPLRPAEYLASKVLTLTALAVVESVVIVGVAYGLDFSLPWLVLSVLLRGALVVALGVAVGVRYRSITQFLLPAIVCSVAFDLPVVWYLEFWPTPLFYLWPTLPSLMLAKAAFLPVDPVQYVYACVYGVIAIVIAWVWALRSLERFVVRGESSA